MAHKTLIGGTAYEIGGGKTLIGGTAYDIKGGKTMVGGTVRNISFGIQIGALAVGSSVFMNVNGARKEFLVVHQGLPSSMYDNSCDGTWLLMKATCGCQVWDSTNNDYANSDIHAYLNGTFLGFLDSDIQSAIKQVKLPYQKGTGSGGSVRSGSDGLSTKIFLLSGYEVGWTTDTYFKFPVDGACLDYFSGFSTYDSRRLAYSESTGKTSLSWFLRSPNKGNSTSVFIVDNDAEEEGYVSSTCKEHYYAYYTRPALILPSDTLVDVNFNVIA